jgi:hypothetical protein
MSGVWNAMQTSSMPSVSREGGYGVQADGKVAFYLLV